MVNSTAVTGRVIDGTRILTDSNGLYRVRMTFSITSENGRNVKVVTKSTVFSRKHLLPV